MELGQLSTQSHRPVSQQLQHIRQRGPQFVGRLMEHHGALLRRQPGQCLPPLLFVGREESLKGETPGGQTRHRQSAHGGAAAGDSLHRDAVFPAQPHQILAGIADGRGPGVRHQRTRLPGQQPGQNGLPGGGPVVLVVADQRLFDVEMVQQLHGHTGVFGGDEVCLLQGLHPTGGQIPQIADGGGYQI